MIPCLDPATLAGWVAGTLSDVARADAIAHVAMCAVCREAGSMLAKLETRDRGDAVTSEPALVGGRLGRYEIRRVLGRGGMGIVVAARDPALDRDVAIKILRPTVDAVDIAALEARLTREARALAQLRHANVVPVYDVRRDGDWLFLVMELVDGVSLRGWLERARTVATTLAVFVEAGHGLAALHAAGLVHRDVKPENILLARDGRVLIVDLGLVVESNADTTRLTRVGVAVGTPRYMAPEQAAGEVVDARADQYAFAVMIREALGTGVPPRLDAVLARATAFAARDRFASITELLAAIEHANGARHRKIIVAAAAATAIAGITALAMASSGAAPDRPVPSSSSRSTVPLVAAVEPESPIQRAASPAATGVGSADDAGVRPAVTRDAHDTAISHVKTIALPAATHGADTPPRAPAGSTPRRVITTAAAESLLSAVCVLPRGGNEARSALDWGEVERREPVELDRFGTARETTLYVIAGQRAHYVIDAAEHADTIGVLVAEVGELVAICPGPVDDISLPAGLGDKLNRTFGFGPLAGPPALAAHQPPLYHVMTIDDAMRSPGVWALAPGTQLLVPAVPRAVIDDTSYDIGSWILEVPLGTPGADTLAVNRKRFVVAEFDRFSEANGARVRPVLRAISVHPRLLAPAR